MRAKNLREQDFYDVHHIYYPRKRYRGQLESRFRNLPCNKVRLHRSAHNELHATQKPPKKPGKPVMAQAILDHKQRRCGCHA